MDTERNRANNRQLLDSPTKESRRLHALHLKEIGWRQRDIATALNVTEGAVSQWMSAARAGGISALRSHMEHGRRPKLAAEQKRLIPDFLWHGAEAYGFRGDFWSCARLAKVLEWELRISYSKSQVSRLLKSIGWTRQVPITRAIQRDEHMIGQWRSQIWPQLKQQAWCEGRTLGLMDESGFYLLPNTIKTYAPKGRTPVLRNWQSRQHLSVMAAITPHGKIYTLVRDEALNEWHTIELLSHLRHCVGRRLLVIVDRSPIHRSAKVKEFIAENDTIRLEMLPPYAPDLNPVEWMWRHFKQIELPNVTCMDLKELHREFDLALKRLRQKPYIVRSFFDDAELEITDIDCTQL
jgi:transposase